MAVLEDLPQDVLMSIVSRIQRRRDLYCLSGVCRSLHQAVSPYITDVNLYWYLNFEDGLDADVPSTVREYDGTRHYRSMLHASLLSFLNFPRLALYVEEIHLEWHYITNGCFFQFGEDERPTLLETIFKQTGLLEWKVAEELVEALREGQQEAYVAILLLLLDNLEVLHITVCRCDYWVQRAIKQVASKDFMPLPLSSGLRNLRRVEIPWNSIEEEFGVPLDSIAPFFLLPSIEELTVEMVDDRYNFNWEGTSGSSTVTELSIQSGFVNEQALKEMLRIPKALTYFWYRYVDLFENMLEEESADEMMMAFRTDMQIFLVNRFPDCSIVIG